MVNASIRQILPCALQHRKTGTEKLRLNARRTRRSQCEQFLAVLCGCYISGLGLAFLEFSSALITAAALSPSTDTLRIAEVPRGG